MRNLLLIPALCILCVGCNPGNNTGYGKTDKTQESSSDWVITTKVKAAIVADSSLSASARLVSVTTNNGVVTLAGSVPTQADIDRIVKITKDVNGVVSIDNQLTVSSS